MWKDQAGCLPQLIRLLQEAPEYVDHDVCQRESTHHGIEDRVGFQLKISCFWIFCPAGQAKTACGDANKGNNDD